MPDTDLLAAAEEKARRLKGELPRSAKLIRNLIARVRELEAIIAKHNLCHDLHGKVGRDEFEEGCRRETVKEFGSCGWADRIAELEARVRELEQYARDSTAANAQLEQSLREAEAERDRLNRRNAELTTSEEQMASQLRVAESHRKMVCGVNDELTAENERLREYEREHLRRNA